MKTTKISLKLKKHIFEMQKTKGVCAFIIKQEQYSEVITASIALFTKVFRLKGIYVTFNKPCDQIEKELANGGINTNTVFFIDSVSARSPSSKNCVSLQGNKSLTEVSIAITETCKDKSIQFVFFDSLTSLLTYHKKETVEQFMIYLMNKIVNLNIVMILLSINETNSDELMTRLSSFCKNCVFF